MTFWRPIFELNDFLYRTVNAITSLLLFVFGLYHLFMFYKRTEERENLYYGVMAVSLAVYFANFYITKIPGFIHADISYLYMQKIFFPARHLAAAMFALFVRDFLHQQDNKPSRYALYITAIVPIIILIMIPTYKLFFPVGQYTTIFILYPAAYIIFCVVRGLRNNVHDAKILLVGTMPVVITTVADVLIHTIFPGTKMIYLLPFGIPLFFLLILFILASRFMNSRNEVEDLNIHLEKKVEDRTIELRHAKEEIEAAMEETSAINENLIATNAELENARSIADRDMKMAINVQRSLFPNKPINTEWDIAIMFKPMSGVSGDFYDFYEARGGGLNGVGLFDVSGHGIASGLITMLAKTIIGRQFNRLHERKTRTGSDINQRYTD